MTEGSRSGSESGSPKTQVLHVPSQYIALTKVTLDSPQSANLKLLLLLGERLLLALAEGLQAGILLQQLIHPLLQSDQSNTTL